MKTLQELIKVLALMERRKWPFIFSCLVASLSVASLPIINSLLYQRAINGAVTGETQLLLQAGLLMVLTITMICIITPSTAYLSNYLAQGTIKDLRFSGVSHLFTLPIQDVKEKGSGDILSRLTNDLNKLGDIYNHELFNLFQDTVIGFGGLVTIFILDWRLALVVLGFGIITGLGNAAFARPMRVIGNKTQRAMATLTQSLLDVIQGNQTIKLFNLHQVIGQRFSHGSTNVATLGVELSKREAQKESLNLALTGATMLCVLGAGLYFVGQGQGDLGSVVAVMSLKPAVDDLFMKLGGTLATLQKSLAGSHRYMEFMDTPSEALLGYKACDQDTDAIKLSGVYFSYDRPVLRDLNLRIPKGKVVALVGPSGAGKSTILKLLTATITPQKGRIAYLGKEISLDWIRSQVALVSQDPYLFATSIAENISYGKPKATMAEIIQAAKSANAHEFITALPQGYDTILGEGGSKLSGGQRQRLAIARAFIKDAPILLLDEATSALDGHAQSLVQAALEGLMVNRTTVVVAHRLSTIKGADLIYVLDNGAVIDQGGFSQLALRPGLFRELYVAKHV